MESFENGRRVACGVPGGERLGVDCGEQDVAGWGGNFEERILEGACEWGYEGGDGDFVWSRKLRPPPETGW
jgi:hypothetical protein